MGEEKKTSSIIPKAEALRKAGFSPAMTVVLVIISMPAFWEFFFDKTGDEAKRKAEVAYEVLANEVKHLREDDESLRKEISMLRRIILFRGGMAKAGGSPSGMWGGMPTEDGESASEAAAEEEAPTIGEEDENSILERPTDAQNRIEIGEESPGAKITVSPDMLEPAPVQKRATLPSLEEAMEQVEE